MKIFDRLKNLKKGKEDEKVSPSVQSGLPATPPSKPVGSELKAAKQGSGQDPEKRGSKTKTPAQYLLAAKTLLRPHITEKASRLQHQRQVVFDVPLSANKTQIKQAIEIVYGLTPKAVQITRLPRKTVWFGRSGGQTRLRKKAIAVFDRNQNLEAFSHV